MKPPNTSVTSSDATVSSGVSPLGALDLRGVNKAYGTQSILKDLWFSVEGGSSFALLGASGCGKTTTLNIVAGIDRQDAGQVLVDGKEVSSLPAHRRDIGVVFQGYALFPHMTVAKNIAFGLRASRASREVVRERVDWALKLGRLQGLEDRHPSQLSGGQQQRVAVVRSLVTRPRLLLLDEPLSNLDTALRAEMRHELKRIKNTTGVTTVLVTHDQSEAMELGDAIAVMSGGRLLQVGDPASLYEAPESAYVATLLGSMNFLPSTLTRGRDGEYTCELGETRFPIPAGRIPEALAKERTISVGIRPEALRCQPSVDSADNLCLQMRVLSVTHLGPHLEATLSLKSNSEAPQSGTRIRMSGIRPEEWTSVTRNRSDPAHADDVSIFVDMSALHFFVPVKSDVA